MGVELVGFSVAKTIGKPPQRNRELNNENRFLMILYRHGYIWV